MASLGSLVATIRVDVGTAIEQVNSVANAIQNNLGAAMRGIATDLARADFSKLTAGAQSAAVAASKVAVEAAETAAKMRETAAATDQAETQMVELATASKSVSGSARAASEVFKTWPEYLKAARAEQKRLEEATKGVADMTRAALRAQEELNRATAYRGPAKVAPQSIGIDLGQRQRDLKTGQWMDSINTATAKLRDQWLKVDNVVEMVNGELVEVMATTERLNAEFRAADVAAMGIKVQAQGVGGYVRATTASMDAFAASMARTGQNMNSMTLEAVRLQRAISGARIEAQGMGGYMVASTRQMRDAAAAAQRVGANLNVTSVAAAHAAAELHRSQIAAQGMGGYIRALVPSLERVAASAKRVGTNLNASSVGARKLTNEIKKVSQVNTKQLTSEFMNLAAMVAPGGGGRLIFGMGSLGRLMQSVGSASVGLGVAIGGLVAGLAVATIGVGAFVGAIKNLIETGVQGAATVENLLISFEALTGSAEAAHSEIQALVDLAVKSPFKLDTLLDLDRMLLSQGVRDGLMRGKLVTAINNIGSAFGRTDADIQNLGRAVAQVFGRGYLSGDELRQLYNQMIPIWDLLRTLPGFSDAAQSKLRKLSEQQEISAQDMGIAFDLFARDMARAAEMQAQSLTGMKQRIQELREARLGLAFLQVEDTHLGPLEAIRNVLLPIIETLESLDFRPLAASIGTLFQGLLTPFQGLATNTSFLVKLFQVYLPTAIEVLGIIIREFAQGLSAIQPAFIAIWNVVKQVAPAIGIAFAIGLGVIIGSVNAAISAFALLYAAVGTVIGLVRGFIALVSGGDAAGAVSDTIDSVKGGVAAFGQFITAGSNATKSILNMVAGIQAINIEVDEFGKEAPPIFSDGGEGLEHVAEAAGKGSGGAAKAVSELNEEFNKLWELTRRIFGQRSDLEQGFLGEEGFEGTVDSIIAMGQQLIEIFEKIGDVGVTSIIRNATYQLINLAKRREEAAKRLEAAEEALANAIEARDNFANGLRQSALDFANALDLETRNEQRWRHVAAQGFFIVEEVEKQESFTEALKRRIKAMREFFTQIQILAKRGLDMDLLGQLFAAGPEEAGEIVAGLVEGGAAAVSETNALQNQIKTLADQMAAYGAQKWHAVGVAEAQALVNGIKGELAVIQASAIEVAELVYNSVLPYAKKMKDLGKEATGGAGGLAGGIAGGMGGLNAQMSNVNKVWDDYHGGMQEKAQKSGEVLMDPADAELAGFLGTLQTATTTIDNIINGKDGIVPMIQTSLDSIEINIIEWLPDAKESRDSILAWFRKIIKYIPGGAIFNVPDIVDNLTNSSASSTAAEGAEMALTAAPSVNVYIGDQELRGLVRTEMVVQETDNAVRLVRGRR